MFNLWNAPCGLFVRLKIDSFAPLFRMNRLALLVVLRSLSFFLVSGSVDSIRPYRDSKALSP